MWNKGRNREEEGTIGQGRGNIELNQRVRRGNTDILRI